MSGAAGIAAAKNRRSKPDPNQKLSPIVSCSSKNGSCPPQIKTSSLTAAQTTTINSTTTTLDNLVNPYNLQILGPMPPAQILRLHEQRLNKFDERINEFFSQDVSQTSEADIYNDRVNNLESKIAMLEEVIMTLQNKLTIAQNFAMETNLNMSRLINSQIQTPLQSPTLNQSPIIAEQTVTPANDNSEASNTEASNTEASNTEASTIEAPNNQ